MKTVILGSFLGALVVVDPAVTAYLFRDFPWMHDLPYLLSITTALVVCAVFMLRAFAPGLVATASYEYWRYFPLLFLVCYQFTAVAAGPIDPTEIVIAVFMPLYLAGLFILPEQRFIATPFNMLHVALAICFAVSLASEFKPLAFLKGFKPFVLFFLMVNFLPREDLIKTFLRWLVVLAVLSAVFALVQELAWVTTQTTLSVLPEKELKMQFEEHFGVPMFRPGAMMAGYPVLALYLATAGLLSVSALLWRNESALLRPRWLIVGLCFIVPAIFFTFSKPIGIGCGLAVPLLLIMRWPNRGALLGLVGGLAVVLVILVLVAAIVPGNIDTAVDVTKTVPKSEVERIRLDRDSIEGFLHGPYIWTGRGIGAGYRYTAHSRRWPAHNAFILAAAELGIVGLAVYIMICGLVVARVVSLNIVVRRGPYLFVVRALPAILIVVLIQYQFTADYLDMFVWSIFALVEALWFKVRREEIATTGPLANNIAV